MSGKAESVPVRMEPCSSPARAHERQALDPVANDALVEPVLQAVVRAVRPERSGADAVEILPGKVPVLSGSVDAEARRLRALLDVREGEEAAAAPGHAGQALPHVRHAAHLQVIVLVPVDGVGRRGVDVQARAPDVGSPEVDHRRQSRPGGDDLDSWIEGAKVHTAAFPRLVVAQEGADRSLHAGRDVGALAGRRRRRTRPGPGGSKGRPAPQRWPLPGCSLGTSSDSPAGREAGIDLVGPGEQLGGPALARVVGPLWLSDLVDRVAKVVERAALPGSASTAAWNRPSASRKWSFQ